MTILIVQRQHRGKVMALALDFEGDQVEVHASKFADLSRRIRRLARAVQNVSELQPDFLEKLEGLQNELKSITYQLRGMN